MGLSIGCECDEIVFRASSYTGFGRWRKILAKTLDINLDDMEGFDGKEEWTGQPFQALLNHSDCDGMLTPKQSTLLLENIKQLEQTVFEQLPKVIKEIGIQRDMGVGNMGYDLPSEVKYWGSKFVLWKQAIQHSSEQNCALIFC